MSGKAVNADSGAAEEFPEILLEIINEGTYLHEQAFNMDEAGLYWKRMPDQSYVKKEGKKKKRRRKADARLEAAKDKLTLSLGGNVSVI